MNTRKARPLLVYSSLFLLILYILPIGFSLSSYLIQGNKGKAWWESASADNTPSHSTPPDAAVIQVYAARTGRWRGTLGVHTWIAVKPSTAMQFTRIEVFGFYLRRYGSTISLNQRAHNRYWFGSTPQLLRQISGGAEVDDMIDRLYKAAEQYPYDNTYRLWPGPNSNTFVAWLARAVPELNLELPVTAVGKDYLPNASIIKRTLSQSGLQFSIAGVFGLLAGIEEGVEVNVLGFSAGIDFSPPAIKLPGIGRVGYRDVEFRQF